MRHDNISICLADLQRKAGLARNMRWLDPPVQLRWIRDALRHDRSRIRILPSARLQNSSADAEQPLRYEKLPEDGLRSLCGPAGVMSMTAARQNHGSVLR